MGICEGKFNIKADDTMRLAVYLFFLLIVIGIAGGCSGNADVSKSTNAPGSVSNTIAASNSGQTLSSNAPPSNPAAIPTAENAIENPNRRKVIDVPGEGRPVMRYEPAAEDSQIASAMNSGGQMFEIRIWKKHPQLLKVESIWVDQKNKALTIILRTGQVMNITTDRIPNLKLATANQLLEIAGVHPTTGTPAVRGAPKKAQ